MRAQPLLELLRLLLEAEIKTCRATTQYKCLKTSVFKVLGEQRAFHVMIPCLKHFPEIFTISKEENCWSSPVTWVLCVADADLLGSRA